MAGSALSRLDVVASPRPETRIMVSIPGRYSLASRLNERGNRRVFACRAVNMSPTAVALAVPVTAAAGERVIAHIERFGKIDGSIIRVLERGFVMSVKASAEERARIEDKLIWLDKHKNLELPDNRQSERIVPHNPSSTLSLGDGTRLSCFVIDMSATGAAVSAEYYPEIGEVVAVGKAVGRVVRHFREGFAIQFVRPLSAGNVEHTLIV